MLVKAGHGLSLSTDLIWWWLLPPTADHLRQESVVCRAPEQLGLLSPECGVPTLWQLSYETNMVPFLCIYAADAEINEKLSGIWRRLAFGRRACARCCRWCHLLSLWRTRRPSFPVPAAQTFPSIRRPVTSLCLFDSLILHYNRAFIGAIRGWPARSVV